MKQAGVGEVRPERFQRFEHNYISLQAIIDGVGVGIGGIQMLGHDLQGNRLVTR